MQDLRDCLPYVQYLCMEHRRLNEALQRISGLLMESDTQNSSISTIRLVEMLTQLRTDLGHHFAQEESGGCIEEAVSRHPGLSPDAKKVEAQHPVLLNELDCLIQHIRSEASVATTRREFEHFADTLKEHESAENRILRMGFGITED